MTLFRLAWAALRKPEVTARVLVPFAPTFAAFAVFVVWNDGIVLGEVVWDPIDRRTDSLTSVRF
jgi:DIE2/ALG10 family